MQSHIQYSQKNEHIECIYYKDATMSYPSHTHTAHMTFGFLLEGILCIICDGTKRQYQAGEHFCIPPDTSHAIVTVGDTPYSMVCLCVAVDKMVDEDSRNVVVRAFSAVNGKTAGRMSDRDSQTADKVSHEDGTEMAAADVRRLKQLILSSPENAFSIKEMAHHIGISPYHMIRQFKAVCGLTPHQFQIQCRVRKAQRLLEQGESVIEAAYAAGFCDQSHFDRCFQKIVRLTPREYKRCLL